MQKYWAVAALFLTISASAIFPGPAHGAAAIKFVQGNYAVPQSPQATVTVPFRGAQTAGNLNVVVVGWNDSTATVTGVMDSKGNAYSLGVGPTVMTGNTSQTIYFAKNIAAATAGANVVTVRFNVAAVYPDIRVLEYSGLDIANPLVGHAAAVGNSALSNSGSLTTTTPNVLLVAANVVETTTSGPGASFTNRMITNPNGDIVEDRIVTAAGTYSGTAPLSSGYWVMQLVAFTAPGSGSPPTVSITAPAANATVSGTVTITATASDSVGVAGVQFKVDGANLGAEVTTAPYSIAWNTTGASNGSHSLTAVARNTSNLTTTSAAVPVTVSNSGSGTATIKFIQRNYAVPQSPQATVTIPFLAGQTAGDLNVVVVGWNDSTATVTTVTDSTGNAYSLAIGPTVLAGNASQVIYFAKNINAAAAGANVVTVRFNVAAAYPDIRVLEYSGVDIANPVVGSAAAVGNSALSNSGSLITTTPHVVLVAANVVGTVTSGPGANFTSRMITDPNGDIVEDRIVSAAGTYSATAPLSSSYWVMQMVAFAAGAAPPLPTMSITAPAANATVSGTVTVAATAANDLSVVAGVQFKLDGANLGAEVTSAPYFESWNTTTAAEGQHVLTAVARDNSSNTTTSNPITVTVSNATGSNPSRIGQWSAPFAWPLVAVHMTLLPNGQILAWDGAAQQGAAYVWNPSTNAFMTVLPPDNIFCAGHYLLPDGRVFVVGGHNQQNGIGLPNADFFDPSSQVWSAAPPMAFARWYPTVTLLPDGRMLVVSGSIDCESCIADIPEIYDPGANAWSQLSNARLALPLYPHLFVLSDGRVVATGAFESSMAAQVLDLNAGTWSTVDPNVANGHSSAMFSPGKILQSGTSANSDPPYTLSQATTYVLDMNLVSPRWRQTPPMAFPRSYHNLTLLPDGSVLVTGGEQTTNTFDETQAVLAAELWSPTGEAWTTMASMTVPRLYHSTALLLPDGRILVAGGGRFGNPTGDYQDKLNAEIYSPPYLFKGPRPVISSAPTLISHNSTFSVTSPDASRIASVSLLHLGSVTHHFNQGQRFLNLSFQQIGSTLIVQTPVSANDALPGEYMLFIVDGNGIPSVASIVTMQ